MGSGSSKVQKFVVQRKDLKAKEHVTKDKAIIDVGHSVLHYDADNPYSQAGYFFQPHTENLVGKHKRPFRYFVRPPAGGGDDGKHGETRLYFVSRRHRGDPVAMAPTHERKRKNMMGPGPRRSVVMSQSRIPKYGEVLKMQTVMSENDEFGVDDDEESDYSDEEEDSESSDAEDVVKCNICGNPPTEPMIASCGDICCTTCWKTYILENQKSGSVACPACEEPLQLEGLKKVDLCAVCHRLPAKDEKTKRSPCGHMAHANCWDRFLSETDECPVCGKEGVTQESLK